MSSSLLSKASCRRAPTGAPSACHAKKPRPPPNNSMARLPEGRWLDVDGIRTRYFEAGSGEPVGFIYRGNLGTGDSAPRAYTRKLNLAPPSPHVRAGTFQQARPGETD